VLKVPLNPKQTNKQTQPLPRCRGAASILQWCSCGIAVVVDAVFFGWGFTVPPPAPSAGSAYTPVSLIWAYIIAAWWLEG